MIKDNNIIGTIIFTNHQLTKSICNDLPPSPIEYYPHIPPNIINAVLKAIDKSPVNRFQTCNAFKDALLNTRNKIEIKYPNKEISIGRAPDNNLVIDDKQISRYHAKLKISDNIIYLIDNKSVNGTYVDGEKVIHSKKIKGNEKITIGKATLDWNLVVSNLKQPILKNNKKQKSKKLPLKKSITPKLNKNKMSVQKNKDNFFIIWAIGIFILWIIKNIFN
tara:strand:- start:121 stop:780 length:660 start_codon:yes stop_codon:yes gene_type:complete